MSDKEKDKIEKPSYKTLVIEDVKYRTLLTKKYQSRKSWKPKNENNLLAFIPGTVAKIFVKEGKKVKEGERMLILEAMKMKNDIIAPFDAVVKKIVVKSGDMVAKNDLLIELGQ